MSYSSVLRFDHSPSPEELSIILGPDYAGGVQLEREGDEVRLAPKRFSIPLLGAFLALILGGMTLFLLNLEKMGLSMPTGDEPLPWILTALWVLIFPTMLGILIFIDRQAALLGPGVVVDLRSRRLFLPWCEKESTLDEVKELIELHGRRRYSGNTSFIVQWAILIEDGDGLTYAPIMKLSGNQKAKELKEFADLCELRVRRVKATRVMD